MRTEDKIKALKSSIEDNASTSINNLARTHNVAEMTMGQLVKDSLNLKPLSKQKVQMLTPLQCQKRVKRSTKIRNFLKTGLKEKVLVFSDEKGLTVDSYLNCQNDTYLAPSAKDAASELKYVGAGKQPAKAFMLGVVMSDGKILPPIWCKGGMNNVAYKHILTRKVFPALQATYGEDGFVWTQDGAPALTRNALHCCLLNKLGSGGFWSKDMWRPSSPNLNPLDFSIWVHVDSKACANPPPPKR